MIPIRVLLVDDDDSQYEFVKALLETVDAQRYDVAWAATYGDGLRRLLSEPFDVALVDQRLGAHSGLELIAAATTAGGETPLIMFTGHGDRDLDLQAMAAGAADYLSKAELTPELLDRALRYAVRHSQTLRLLRQREERFQAIVANVPMAIWTLDAEGTVTFAEGRLLPRFAVDTGGLLGRSALTLYRDRPDVVEAIGRALGGEHVHVTIRLHDGVFEVWYSPLSSGDRPIDGAIGVAVEITERTRLEEQLRQAQKMEAVGRLAGGVAHDFNNLLTAILGYGELAMSELPAGSGVRADVEEMYKAGQSAAGLTRQLLAFSRRQVLQPQVLDLNAVVIRTQSLLRRIIGEDVALSTDLCAAVWPVYADPSQIEQIIMNLAVNARDAMPGGGQLTIRTENVPPAAAPPPGRGTAPEVRHVRLSITDTGTGMTPEVRRRLFDPFFTTKERGKGTGLGLATVYGIVSQSGGFIDVRSEVGQGATFAISLPASSADQPASAGDESVVELRGSETILIVEDQEQVRAVARDMLQRHGYAVLEAPNPQAAIALAHEPARIDLLLTDIVLPEMSGRTLADILVAQRPGLRVLYTSGYTDDRVVHHGVAESGLPFVQKPFSATMLLTKVREVLNAAPHRLMGGSSVAAPSAPEKS